jgi:phosphatidylglycerophosphate synthase
VVPVLDMMASQIPEPEARPSVMTAPHIRVTPRRQLEPAAARPGLDLAAGVLPLAAVTGASCWLLGLPTSHLLEVAAQYALLAGLILLNFPGLSRGPGLGPANRVTLFRATLVLPIAALLLHAGALGDGGAWWIVGLGTVAMVLDGVDGRVARRTGTASAFGARFDMELDSFLLLALSALAWRSGKVGGWVMAVGGMRYLFVAASVLVPALAAELPRSRRRKWICVAAGVALLVALGPIVSAALATRVAAAALLLLAYSFGVDVAWLLSASRRRAAAG